MSANFIHAIACVKISSLQDWILFHHIYATFCLSIHLLMDIWVSSTFWLLWIMPVWTLLYTFMFKSLFAILLGIYPEVELLDHTVILFLIFWGTAILFLYWMHYFTFPSAVHKGSNFSTTSVTLFILFCFTSSHPNACSSWFELYFF